MLSKFFAIVGLCVAASILHATDAANRMPPRRQLGSYKDYGHSQHKHDHDHKKHHHHDKKDHPHYYRRRLEDKDAKATDYKDTKATESSDYSYGKGDYGHGHDHQGYGHDDDGHDDCGRDSYGHDNYKHNDYKHKGYGYISGDDYKGYGSGYSYSYKKYGGDCDDYYGHGNDYYGHGNDYYPNYYSSYGGGNGNGYYPDYYSSYNGGYGNGNGYYRTTLLPTATQVTAATATPTSGTRATLVMSRPQRVSVLLVAKKSLRLRMVRRSLRLCLRTLCSVWQARRRTSAARRLF
ncbi:M96 mating-specific protein, putative [Phytophthora infestans T30-4]|uniref:M96 mating-specific protein, putative n=1 Tax=Phytophthora infestans (strain T30-4) TaxID=403677 RepID=D0N5Z4_PHYIT|nr:M96 mating-specific protein, putative [Phytophthora infestans T30-4]EEY70485.1 M96 mating-specific protein, putative [Phytophthora infestans T30-4]|eukprot:XP_002998139.1 M96 mating-specific protein, putative [Phytophthora infestans T30-4]